jgi:hypothetical protein
MTFLDIVEKQWGDYADRHRNRNDLLIHLIGVPIVWVGAFQLLGGLLLVLLGVPGAFGMLVWAAVLIGGSLFVQARGHAMEGVEPEKFADAGDFAKRMLAEQFINFPRFVLSGRWLANFQAASG